MAEMKRRNREWREWPRILGGLTAVSAQISRRRLHRGRRFAPEAWDGCGEPSLPWVDGGRDAHTPGERKTERDFAREPGQRTRRWIVGKTDGGWRMAEMKRRNREWREWPRILGGLTAVSAQISRRWLHRGRRFAPEAWDGCGEPSLPWVDGGRDARTP